MVKHAARDKSAFSLSARAIIFFLLSHPSTCRVTSQISVNELARKDLLLFLPFRVFFFFFSFFGYRRESTQAYNSYVRVSNRWFRPVPPVITGYEHHPITIKAGAEAGSAATLRLTCMRTGDKI